MIIPIVADTDLFVKRSETYKDDLVPNFLFYSEEAEEFIRGLHIKLPW